MTKKLPKIFVQIASYRDPECQWTIKDLFEKAAHPERIFVGICWQVSMPEDADCFKIPYPYPKQVRVNLVDAKDSKGACWARSLTQKLWQDEEYTLQIDSHMRFEQNWDETLINMLAECDSDKPILSTYPQGYIPPNTIPSREVTALIPIKFDDNNIRFKSVNIPNDKVPKKPTKGVYIAGGYLFASSQIIAEVKYDPNLYLDGEEITLSIRCWTKGWDIYNPNKSVLYHYYLRKAPMHWDEGVAWIRANEISLKRLHHLLKYKISDDVEALKDIEIYGFGNIRTLEDYEEFSGIDFKKRTITEDAKNGVFIERMKGKFMEINDDWKKWAFENIANGGDSENLISIMVEKGLDANACRELMAEIIASPYLSVTKQYQEKLHKREWLLKTLDWHQRQRSEYTQPKKVPLPPFKQFLEEYYYANKIGIFSGAIEHWGASKWTFPDLVEKVGYDSMVEVQKGRDKEKDYEVKGHSLKTQIKFGEFIDKITSGESSNDMYMTANNHPFKNPAMQKLLPDFDNIGDGYFDMTKFADSAFLWLGPKGVITPLHHDLTNNFFIQVKGKKLYHLIPPLQAPYMYDRVFVYSDVKLLESDLNEFPEFKKTSVIQVELEAGDCLFIPIGCWHHVVGLSENISMTLTNMNVNNSFPGFSETSRY